MHGSGIKQEALRTRFSFHFQSPLSDFKQKSKTEFPVSLVVRCLDFKDFLFIIFSNDLNVGKPATVNN